MFVKGPIGAFVVNYASTYFTSALPEVWLYALGGLFVVSTLFLPKGIVGLFEKIKMKKNDKPNQGEGVLNATA